MPPVSGIGMRGLVAITVTAVPLFLCLAGCFERSAPGDDSTADGAADAGTHARLPRSTTFDGVTCHGEVPHGCDCAQGQPKIPCDNGGCSTICYCGSDGYWKSDRCEEPSWIPNAEHVGEPCHAGDEDACGGKTGEYDGYFCVAFNPDGYGYCTLYCDPNNVTDSCSVSFPEDSGYSACYWGVADARGELIGYACGVLCGDQWEGQGLDDSCPTGLTCVDYFTCDIQSCTMNEDGSAKPDGKNDFCWPVP